MLLGSRMLRRSRIVLSASAGSYSTPRDPLLFLYPSLWNRTTTTAQARQAIDTNNEQDTRTSRRPLHLAAKNLQSTGFPADFTAPLFEKKDIQADLNSATDSKRTYSENDIEKRFNAVDGRPLDLRHSTGARKTTNQKLGLVRRVVRGTFREREADGSLVPMPQGLKEAIFKQSSRQATTGRKLGSVVRRVFSELDKRLVQDAYDASVRQSFQDWTRKERNLPLADWRKILYHLKHHTPRQSTDWRDDALRILIPLRFVKELFFGKHNPIWNITAHHVCEIKLAEETVENSGYREIILSGSAISIARAVVEILDLAPGSITDGHPLQARPDRLVTWSSATDTFLPPTISNPSLPAHVPAEIFHKMAKSIRADMVVRPIRWTTLSFATYVEHLTAIRVSNHTHKLLYKPGETHQEIVMKILQNIFLDPECEGVISVYALNNAFKYLLYHSFHSTVHILYLHMDRIGLKMNTETYNMILRSAARNQNLYWFQSVLRMMAGSGCYPNANTWVAFVMAAENLQIKLHAIADMQEKDLFRNIFVRKAVCDQLVNHEIQTALEKGLRQDEFLEHMISRYGQGWLTIFSANKILNFLGSRGLISRCWEFIHFMRAEGINPGIISIATILHHCEKQANYEGAMDVVRRIYSINAFVTSEAIYNCLFNIAWKAKMYATARVIWVYACLDEKTSFLMRRRVRRSTSTAFAYPTVSNSPLGTTTANNLWQSTAGPFILGHPFVSALNRSALLKLKLDLQQARKNLPLDWSLSVQTYDSLITGQEILLKGEGLILKSQNLTPKECLEPWGYVSDNQLQHLLPSMLLPPISLHGDQLEAPPIASSRAPGAKSTNEVIIKVIDRYIGISQEWLSRRPFVEVLLEAWEIDKEWRSHGGMEMESRGAHLQWLSAMAPRILLKRRRRDGHLYLER